MIHVLVLVTLDLRSLAVSTSTTFLHRGAVLVHLKTWRLLHPKADKWPTAAFPKSPITLFRLQANREQGTWLSSSPCDGLVYVHYACALSWGCELCCSVYERAQLFILNMLTPRATYTECCKNISSCICSVYFSVITSKFKCRGADFLHLYYIGNCFSPKQNINEIQNV